MDIFFILTAAVAFRHEFLADIGINTEIYYDIRLRYAYPGILEFIKPAEIFLLLIFRELCTLVYGIGGSVSVSYDDAAAVVVTAPFCLV